MSGFIIILIILVLIAINKKSTSRKYNGVKVYPDNSSTNTKNYYFNGDSQTNLENLDRIQEKNEQIMRDNYSVKAVDAMHKAKEAIKAKQFDAAWRLFHNAKTYFLKHANQMEMSIESSLGLQGMVHEEMANMLRLEGRHKDALTHIIYWIATDNRTLKKHDQKLLSYLKRAKLEHISLSEAIDFIGEVRNCYDFRIIQNKVNEWESKGEKFNESTYR